MPGWFDFLVTLAALAAVFSDPNGNVPRVDSPATGELHRWFDFLVTLAALAAAFFIHLFDPNANVPRVDSPATDQLSPTEELFSAENPNSLGDEDQPPTFVCDWCCLDSHGIAIKCPGCAEENYCSQYCLRDSADQHVRHCKNPLRPLTTADKLAAAVFQDMFSDDPQTNEDYFFTRVRTPHDKTYLFGLYVGVLKILDIKPSTLHEWRLSGTMVENIKALYEPVPARGRGAYYPWFLQHLDIFEPRPNALIAVSSRHLCESCGVSARVRCSACKKVWYCSKKCQESDWGGHLVNCNPNRPITSADHLRAAVHRRKLPNDLDILSEYGFTRVGEDGAKTLLDIYRVVFDEGIRSRDIHQWQTAGNLLQEVEKVLRPLENWKTFQIWPWFEGHRYVFDPTLPISKHDGENQAERIKAAQVQLWNKVGDFPSHNHAEIRSYINSRWPNEKEMFFSFRSALGLGWYPRSEFESWVHFGFCTCQDEAEEAFLCSTYQMLAEYCSYDEFFTAYISSNIIQLLDAKGLRGRRMIHPYLEDALSGSPAVFKSVWPLKQYLRCSSRGRFDLELCVEVDYGFSNCTTDSGERLSYWKSGPWTGL
ncbi:MYND-type domain-containing protein [Mycena sanguinolenta]|uniref:MYND-type domain-containing protein n=1 Tax=Mycena sanguinolenta TaxID=230812 RepID=A0A8H6Y1Q3_9AGAR|nr:MYND-type domain-containing protein [Mycena sanguinolenta]